LPSRSSADHSVSPPSVRIPRDYNAAYDLIERNLAAGRAARIAYIDDAGQYTFAQLAERVNRFGSGLRALGLEMEHRVLLALTDTIDFPTAFLGAIKAGIVPIAVNTLLTPKDYEYIRAAPAPVRDGDRQAALPEARHRCGRRRGSDLRAHRVRGRARQGFARTRAGADHVR
jgi:hypothetical protein